MKLQIHVEASAELDAAAAWYDHEQEGLGDELLEDRRACTQSAWDIVSFGRLRIQTVLGTGDHLAFSRTSRRSAA